MASLYGCVMAAAVKPFSSVNQRLPSGPAVMSRGRVLFVGRAYSLGPTNSSFPIWLALYSVNQRLPSGPVVISMGSLTWVGTKNSVIVPSALTRPSLFAHQATFSIH